MKKLFLIIGAPGSGKTTDAELIAKKHENITHYSTGDMLRAEIASGSKRGEEINSFVSKGLIVPIEIVIETIVTAIKNASTDIVVIDGYPRSIEQMTELDKYLVNESEVELTNVIEVEVSQDTAFKRVLGRAADAEVVRADDNEEVFLNRMKLYIEPLAEIKSFYTQKNLLKVISGEGTIEQIVQEMDEFIQSRV
ncbi:adenylate kinase [Halarcobacter bivalviorum]|uniref:Adenylate kinase n=1 Tax=Halarcobacter bivalviorum TaxID=663364 RepID=A0AAX2AC07_9BACT|nr:adenylate kinase [Halarcobacter bivalviorum]AXH11710.1 adenylate kinase [Halarcobacter bivalviorum]RXK07031.1 adenylate kinase [Halarcobacter bivalviorum]RXK10843.1 adenylate kinase [Halarcobacter bivalviorum]